MANALNNYNVVVDELKVKFANFLLAADSGAFGKGSNYSSLLARKVSMEITESLKIFRKYSLLNDKEKATRKD